ncbi:fluoride efflux transporter CrcB [Rhodococcus sp. NPDC058521]|uniref:fluoride efflux transporter CrcB n=1 Tax=Rhodococcus sp. NPDC058521 TaxID=3346536 RepID=UPI0036578B8F
MNVVFVALGGGVGAGLRYLTGRYVASYGSFPIPTFLVNIVGCFVLGLISGVALPPSLFALLGTGFCGGLTTYSTFAVESVAAERLHRPYVGVLYVAASLIVGLSLAWAGFSLTA